MPSSSLNAFDQAGSLEAMDLDGSADDRVAQFICFVEQWMHELILQKQTKETKEEPKPSSSPSGPSTCKCYLLKPPKWSWASSNLRPETPQ